MVKDGKKRVLISFDEKNLKTFRNMAERESLTLSQLISRKLSNVDEQLSVKDIVAELRKATAPVNN